LGTEAVNFTDDWTNRAMKKKSDSKIKRSNPLPRIRTEGARLKKSNTDLRKLIKSLEESNRALLQQNRKLSKLALKDPHTGVYNRRYLQETLEKELSLASATPNPFR
jgi:PleD family two-component response regulator